MFPLLPSTGRKIAQAAGLAGLAGRRLDFLGDGSDDKFDVKITAYDSATESYTWTRVSYDENGDYEDHQSGLNGSPTWMPLKERNGVVISVSSLSPHYAQAWRRLAISTLGPVYEFTVASGLLLVFENSNTTSAATLAITTGTLEAGEYLVSVIAGATGSSSSQMIQVGYTTSTTSVGGTILPTFSAGNTAYTPLTSPTAGASGLHHASLLGGSGTITVTASVFSLPAGPTWTLSLSVHVFMGFESQLP